MHAFGVHHNHPAYRTYSSLFALRASASHHVYICGCIMSICGRIPPLDAARARLNKWRTLCFKTQGHPYAVATFVDNLLSTGSSPESATAILDDCEAYLSKYWFLSFGADSKEFLVCRGYPHNIDVDPCWVQRPTMKCLGHQLDDDGGISSCYRHCVQAMWRGFYGNLSAGLMASPVPVKMRFLNSCIASIPAFRWPRWPYQTTYAAALDSQQRHMISVLMQTKPQSHETFEAYVKRRHTFSGRLASKHGRWSQLWAQSVRKWNDHVARRHDPDCWSGPILDWHDESWLAMQRSLASSDGESRTGTTVYKEKVHKRWSESISLAALVPNPARR